MPHAQGPKEVAWETQLAQNAPCHISNGCAQDFYFPEYMPGWFKGMKIILEERVFLEEANL